MLILLSAGTNKDESLLWLASYFNGSSPWTDIQEDFDEGTVGIMFNLPPELITEEDIAVAKDILQFYIGAVEDITEETRWEYLNMVTDAMFLYGTFKQVNYLLKHGVPTYQYLMTHVGQHSYTNNGDFPTFGVCHADELQYLFLPTVISDSLEGDDALVADMMTKAWTDFAKTGDPTPPGSNFAWTQVQTEQSHEFLDIRGPNPEMRNDEGIDGRMDCWTQHEPFEPHS